MTDLPTSPSTRDIEKKYNEKEKADLVEPDNLVIASGKGNPKPKELYIRRVYFH